MENLENMQRNYEVIVIKIADGVELHYFPRWIEDPDRLFREADQMSWVLTLASPTNDFSATLHLLAQFLLH